MLHATIKPLRLALLLSVLVLLWSCGGGKGGDDNDNAEGSFSAETPFAYVERILTDDARFTSVAKLMVRAGAIPGTDERDIFAPYCGGEYDVKGLNVSYSGRYLIFSAYCQQVGDTWDIYEYDFQLKTIHRFITDNEIANAGDDVSPTYTNDGQSIIFSSTRNTDNSPPASCEPEDAPKALLLHSMDINGQNIVQLTYGDHRDINSKTLEDGNILFTRQSYQYEILTNCDVQNVATPDNGETAFPKGMNIPNTWANEAICAYSMSSSDGQVVEWSDYSLLRIAPDGSQLQQLYKTTSLPASDEQFLQLNVVTQGSNGRIMALLSHKDNTLFGGDIVELQSPSPNISNLELTVFDNMTPRSLTTGEVNLYPNQISEHGWYSGFWPYCDGSSKMLISWAQCTSHENGVDSFCDADDQFSNVNAQYGIWVFNPATQSRLPIVRPRANKVYTEIAMGTACQGSYFPYEPYNREFIENSSDSGDEVEKCIKTNHKPIAHAGADQEVNVGEIATLDGSGSTDADVGDTLTYQWNILEQPAGSISTFDNAQAVMPQLSIDVQGTYRIQLIVNDGTEDSDADLVELVDGNVKPVADAGPDQFGDIGDSIELDGSGSTDVDGDPLSYSWTIVSMPADSNASLVDPSVLMPTFIIDKYGSYEVQLIVNDGFEDSDPDNVIISTENTRPVADAGIDQSIQVFDRVVLDGSGSSDADGDVLGYQWSLISQPLGSNVTLSNANTVAPNFIPSITGNHVVQLIVNDGQLDSVPDTVTITSTCEASETTPSAGTIDLMGMIRDFNDTHPDFESAFIQGVDHNAVDLSLGLDGKPVYNAAGAGIDFHGQDAFDQWYRDVDGINLSVSYSFTLDNTITDDPNVYTYVNNSFFPIDGELFGNQGRNHNFHFTYEVHSSFTYSGGETFKFIGDDDVWVYIDGKLVIDLGGVHSQRSAEVDVDTLGLVIGETYSFDFFFAERHTTQSRFRIDTGIEFRSTCDN